MGSDTIIVNGQTVLVRSAHHRITKALKVGFVGENNLSVVATLNDVLRLSRHT